MESDGTEVTVKDLWKYFSRTNYINKNIIDHERSFVKYLGDRWESIPNERKDALLDLLFVNDEIRGKYEGQIPTKTGSAAEDEELQESFPRLFLDSGQKINVDFENDLWTWRDEHSGPFSWMSRSQQDLTLADLEPDTISKPQSKTSKLENDNIVKPVEPQFIHPSNSWCLDVLEEYKKNEEKVVLTPSPSINLTSIRIENSQEELNEGFEDPEGRDAVTVQPVVSDVTQEQKKDAETCEEEKVDSVSEKKSKPKDRGRRSPSPKKMIRSGSFKKSPAKNGDQQLITKDDPDTADENNAFSNPLMETEWSTFVGEEAQSETSFTHKPQTSAPPRSMTIDRGDIAGSDSPYRGDRIQLIEQSNSPSIKLSSPSANGWSEESTPDHTTHLLKGLQSPVHHRNNLAYASSDTGSDMAVLPPPRDKAETEDEAEDEEILKVEVQGQNITVTSEVEPKTESDSLKTGFDFLDNW